MRITNIFMLADIPNGPGIAKLINYVKVSDTGDFDQKAYIYNYDLRANEPGKYIAGINPEKTSL
jgi:hypothetical protein